jgi:hypothetical protein
LALLAEKVFRADRRLAVAEAPDWQALPLRQARDIQQMT